MRQQGDGTTAPRPMAEADKEWLDTALKSAMIDLGKRMQDIKETLDAGDGSAAEADAAGEGASLQERERLLDELMDIVEQIDLARGGCCTAAAGDAAGGGCRIWRPFRQRHASRRFPPHLPPPLPACPADLQTIGGLQTLLDLLGSPHASLRWRAAEVAATCVQNNPPVQVGWAPGLLLCVGFARQCLWRATLPVGRGQARTAAAAAGTCAAPLGAPCEPPLHPPLPPCPAPVPRAEGVHGGRDHAAPAAPAARCRPHGADQGGHGGQVGGAWGIWRDALLGRGGRKAAR